MELLIVLAVVFVIIVIFAILLSEAEDKKKEQMDKEIANIAQEKFLNTYGCTEEEMKKRICTSPAIDQIINIMKQDLPSSVEIRLNGVFVVKTYEIESWGSILFKDIGLSNLPSPFNRFSLNFRKVLGDALKEKLPGYQIKVYDNGEVYLINDSLRPVQDHSIKGW